MSSRIPRDIQMKLRSGDMSCFENARCNYRKQDESVRDTEGHILRTYNNRKLTCHLEVKNDLPEEMFETFLKESSYHESFEPALSYRYSKDSDRPNAVIELTWYGFIKKDERWYNVQIDDYNFDGVVDGDEISYAKIGLGENIWKNMVHGIKGTTTMVSDEAQQAYTGALKAAGLIP